MGMTIEQLRAQIAAEIAAEFPLPPPQIIWTTAAELRVIEGIRRKGNRRSLEGMLASLELRHWDGAGMAVNAGEVRQALEVALGGLF